EGLAMYAGAPGFVKSREAVRLYREGRPLVVAERLLAQPAFDGFDASRAEFSSGVRPSGENYLFFRPPRVP
ncbi:MAG: hypothetical protein N2322_06250, partial [Terrimicrobiaceae bacterium]|nr:hypothetical protein [Terrimicrobiaceae bacterium]